jgi:hypothetical protein
MPLIARRVQLAAPTAASTTVPSLSLKRAADDPAAPPHILKRQFCGPDEPCQTTCAIGCLRADRSHVGLCITVDGPMPPSIKRLSRLAKAGRRVAARHLDDSAWTATGGDGVEVGEGADEEDEEITMFGLCAFGAVDHDA